MKNEPLLVCGSEDVIDDTVELITDEELEIQIRQAEEGILEDGVSWYCRQASKYPLLSQEEEQALIKEYKEHQNIDARNQLIMSNTRLVISIAKKYKGVSLSFLDAIQDGNLGLLKAVEKFQPEKGYRFATYATYWVRQSISEAISNSSLIRIPQSVQKQYRSIVKLKQQMENSLGRELTDEEFLEIADIPADSVMETVRLYQNCQSLDEQIKNEKDNASRYEKVASQHSPNPEELMLQQDVSQAIMEALKDFSDRERLVIILRYGLDGQPARTREEIGQIFHISTTRVGQIENKVLRKLKSPKNKVKLKDFW